MSAGLPELSDPSTYLDVIKPGGENIRLFLGLAAPIMLQQNKLIWMNIP